MTRAGQPRRVPRCQNGHRKFPLVAMPLAPNATACGTGAWRAGITPGPAMRPANAGRARYIPAAPSTAPLNGTHPSRRQPVTDAPPKPIRKIIHVDIV